MYLEGVPALSGMDPTMITVRDMGSRKRACQRQRHGLEGRACVERHGPDNDHTAMGLRAGVPAAPCGMDPGECVFRWQGSFFLADAFARGVLFVSAWAREEG